MEGVMMRAPRGVATAVRRPDGGISVRYRDHEPLTRRFRLLRLPVLRGAVTLVESLIIGTGSLMYSAEEASREEGQAAKKTSPWEKLLFGVVMVFSFALGLGLFFYVPLILTDLTGVRGSIPYNLVDGVFRLVIFFAYLFLITRWGEMRRVFQYHGAEHMTIFNYEAEVPISVENARTRSRLHPRCGTSFLFFVMIVSILVFSVLGRPEGVAERLARIAWVPVIAGISYEVIRLSARFRETFAGRALAAPGMGLQLLTTAPPDDTQLEVAVVALRAALAGGRPTDEGDAGGPA
ncbi:MAG: DUF1385 domain-containing protein [Gemmatimonadota bacterium]|nr:DUF1385 domain-containing protein [Gemmatimonadota bacterium]